MPQECVAVKVFSGERSKFGLPKELFGSPVRPSETRILASLGKHLEQDWKADSGR